MDAPHFDTGLHPEQLRPDRGTPVETPRDIFAIYQTKNGPEAAPLSAPHMDGPLFEGSVIESAEGKDSITCPWHHWRFDLTTSACLDSPKNEDCEAKNQCLRVNTGPNGTLLLSPHSA
ncbi:MAG: Rieske 2Fe-2S domain-containing protein [bacterium]|nr:Rieske 2Fe-2S domain-containing protein [bacterium]